MQEKSILLICGSRKPAPGKKTPSAARELLKIIQEGIKDAGGKTNLIDLRGFELPFFDGRTLVEYKNRDLDYLYDVIDKSCLIVLSVPSYWGGPSGVVKNFLDLLGGPKYRDQANQESPFKNKIVGLLIVGDDDVSSQNAYTDMRTILSALEAWTLPKNLVIGNPRQLKDVGKLFSELKEYGKYLYSLSQKNILA